MDRTSLLLSRSLSNPRSFKWYKSDEFVVDRNKWIISQIPFYVCLRLSITLSSWDLLNLNYSMLISDTVLMQNIRCRNYAGNAWRKNNDNLMWSIYALSGNAVWNTSSELTEMKKHKPNFVFDCIFFNCMFPTKVLTTVKLSLTFKCAKLLVE